MHFWLPSHCFCLFESIHVMLLFEGLFFHNFAQLKVLIISTQTIVFSKSYYVFLKT